METSKKNLGKITPFGERIIKVLKDNDLVKPDGSVNYSEAERLCEITGSILSKAVRRKGMGKENFRKFHSYFHVEPGWLKTGKGESKAKNGTAAIKKEQADISNDPLVKSYVREIESLNKIIELQEAEIKRLKDR